MLGLGDERTSVRANGARRAPPHHVNDSARGVAGAIVKKFQRSPVLALEEVYNTG